MWKILFRSRSKILLLVLSLQAPCSLMATPSSHAWTPSADIQPDGLWHLTTDLYPAAERNSSGRVQQTITNLGLTYGTWPIADVLGVEVGFDHITGNDLLDNYPLYFNAKFGVPANKLFEGAPAMAVGGYLFGTEHKKTDQNLIYFKAAKTFELGGADFGRISSGWFWGSKDLLVNQEGSSDENGVMITWERKLPEISNNLSVCVDYQGSDSSVGALVPALSWSFTDTLGLTIGYVLPNNQELAKSVAFEIDLDF